MSRCHLILLVVIPSTGCNPPASPSPTPPPLTAFERAIFEFNFEGNTIGSSLADYKKRNPQAIEMGMSEHRIGYVVMRHNATAASLCDCGFVDGMMLTISATYTRPDIDRMGGNRVFAEKIREKFGTYCQQLEPLPQFPNATRTRWDFKNSNRIVNLVYEANLDITVLSIIDMGFDDLVISKRVKAGKSGFD